MIPIESDGSINFTPQMLERAACSAGERRTLFPLVRLIMDLTERAGKDGILVLEKTVAELQPRLFREGIRMALDGNDPRLIARELYYRAFCGGMRGLELFRSLVCFEGVRGIQQGWHPIQVRDAVLALFGADMIEETEKCFDMNRDALRARVADRLAAGAALPAREPCTLLEEPVGKLQERFVYRLTVSPEFQNMHLSDVALALSAASGAVRKKMLAAMPPKQALYVADNYAFTPGEPVNDEHRERRDMWTTKAQEKIVGMIEALKERGEIIY